MSYQTSIPELLEEIEELKAQRDAARRDVLKWARPEMEGYDLVAQQDDPSDFRRKILVLTPRGRQIAKELDAWVEKQKRRNSK